MTAEDVKHAVLSHAEEMEDHRFGYAPKDEGWVLACIEIQRFIEKL